MNNVEKIKAVQFSPELLKAVGLLAAVFEDTALNAYIRYTYEAEGVKYELTFLKLQNEIIYEPQNIQP